MENDLGPLQSAAACNPGAFAQAVSQVSEYRNYPPLSVERLAYRHDPSLTLCSKRTFFHRECSFISQGKSDAKRVLHLSLDVDQ